MIYERLALTTVVVLASSSGQVHAQHSSPRATDSAVTARDFADDHFAAGDVVAVITPVPGDLLAAGRHVRLGTSIGGDAALAGGEVRVRGRVGQDLYAIGGNIAVYDTIVRNVRIAGGQLTVAPTANLKGNLSSAGGDIRIQGRVAGYLQAVGGHVYLDAPIGGDVDITANEVELGPAADIAGKLRYASDHDLRQAPGARIQGGIEHRPPPAGWERPGRGAQQFGRAVFGIWTIGMMLLAALLVLVLPGVSARVAATLQAHPGKSALLGFGLVIGGPIAVLLLLITLVGIPAALLGIALYGTLLLVGYLGTGMALGDWALRRFRPADPGGKLKRAGAAMLAVLVIALAGRIPVLGVLIGLLALFAGIGAVILAPRGFGRAASS